jgi:hypothetical protein
MALSYTLVFGIFSLLASGQQIVPLSQADIDNFLNIHNNARRTTTPLASNMLQMQWDYTLQNVAQNYAVKCIWAHNPSRTTEANGKFKYVGENIYYWNQNSYLSTSEASTRAVNAWNSEKQVYSYYGNQCNPIPNDPFLWTCGHYTQNVWANTRYIGCAVA